ncbi:MULTISPECIES: cutinase family protein [Corynebacterium]|uniref:cutinase family protein n=1 Tax=Corynebacterium TaxID=1716 RepID=UPI00124D02FB|nr:MULTISPECIES: cutinase family protein [Corynebacterium]
MRAFSTLVASLSATALVTAVTPLAAAEPDVTVSKNDVAASEQCPAIQMVLINSSFDSVADADTDTGFFSGVSEKVMASNDGDVKDKSAGFGAFLSDDSVEPTEESGSSTGSGLDSDSLWTSGQDGSDDAVKDSSSSLSRAGDSLWGESASESETLASEEGEEVTAENSRQTTLAAESSVSSSPSSAQDAGDSAQKVGRIYVNFDDSGGYIPGVNGEERAEYSEAVSVAVDRVNSVLGEIHQQCPSTRVVLMGYSEGAQVGNEVAKQIGSGSSSFPADRVAGVALFSDPTRGEDQPLVAGGGASPAAAPGTSGENTSKLDDGLEVNESLTAPEGAGVATLTNAANSGGSVGPVSSGFGALNDRVMSFCMEGDSTCAIPASSPLRKIIAASAGNIDLNDPQRSLMAVADTLGPAVVLGGVESLADDLSFGPNGFEIARAESTDQTMIARIANETDRSHDLGDMGQRLVQSGLQLGGMALAAGVTFAKEVVTPTNLAQIAAAGAADPVAAVPVVAAKLAAASLKIITPVTATGVALRVFDEIKAAGLGDAQVAEIATQAATWKSIGSGAYQTTPVTNDGRSATDFAADWVRAAVGDASGSTVPDLGGATAQAATLFDSGAVNSALSMIGG